MFRRKKKDGSPIQSFVAYREKNTTLRFTGELLAIHRTLNLQQWLYRTEGGNYVYAEKRFFPVRYRAVVIEGVDPKVMIKASTIHLLRKASEKDADLERALYTHIQ